MAAEISTKETGNQMKNTNALVFHVMQELRKDPRPTCLPCLGITAPEHWVGVHTHISSQYRLQYRFEDGLCQKCKTTQTLLARSFVWIKI